MALSSEALAIIGIVLTVLVALCFFILDLRTNHPKLISWGGGDSTIRVPNKDVMASHITIFNDPSFLGMKINREPARITSARIHDPAMKEYVGPVLMWRKDGSQELERECVIEAGKSRSLYLFAKERFTDEYFVYSTNRLDSELPRLTAVYKDKKKDFSVDLFDAIGRRYRFGLAVRNSDQSANVSHKLTWHHRWSMIREAFQLLGRACSFR